MQMNQNKLMTLSLLAAALLVASPAQATVVSAFDTAYTANGQWYTSDVRTGGSASIVSLIGQGGNLENNQPLPTGAALLTTDNTNAAKVEVSVSDAYGAIGNILSSLSLSYDYYRSNIAGTNTAAAPSLKLVFFNQAYAQSGGDGFVSLVYEAYWQSGAASDPTSDAWTNVSIDHDSGLFWQTGGFGQSGSAGGAPLKTLDDWFSTFDADFADASLTAVSIGVGTYNPGQIGYFDNVLINRDGYSAAYDFELASSAVPEPATLLLVGLGLAGLATKLRKRTV